MNRFDDAGKLLLRIAVGGLMLFHGISKLQKGIGGIETRVTDAGLPAFVALGVYVGEIIAPVLILLGIWTRPAALIVAVNMLFVIGLAHSKDIFALSPKGGAWAIELQMFYLLTALALACVGSGRFTITGRPN